MENTIAVDHKLGDFHATLYHMNIFELKLINHTNEFFSEGSY